jgi:hypothetical protein
VNRMLEGKAFEALVKMFGDEGQARDWLESYVDETNRAIEEEGAITRSVEDQAGDEEGAEAERVVELDEEAMAAIVERVEAGIGFGLFSEAIEKLEAQIAGLSEQLDALKAQAVESESQTEERLAALERTDEEKEAEWVQDLPRKQTVRVTHRPRVVNDPNYEPSMADVAAATLANAPGGN